MTELQQFSSGEEPVLHDAWRAGVSATQRGDFPAALRIFSTLSTAGQLTSMEARSYYGVALALGEKRFNLAIKMCSEAVSEQFYDSTRYVNLVKVFLAAGSRRRAVETLDMALSRMPKDRELLALRNVIGYRSEPVLRFLSRSNPLNKALGRWRHRRRQRAASGEGMSTRTVIFAVVGTLVWTGVLLFLLIRYAM